MEQAYPTWIGIVALGALAGVFVRPRWVAIVAAGLVGACVTGLVLNTLLGGDRSLGWALQFGALVLTVLGAVAFAGAWVTHSLVGWLRRRREGA